MTFNITELVIAILGIVFASLLTLVAKANKIMKAKLEDDQISLIREFVDLAVRAAEQMYKSGEGEKKLEYALNWVTERLLDAGITVNVDTIRGYIEAAVLELSKTFFDYADYDYDEELDDSEE